jgi:microcystin-dependent protein
MAEPFLSEIRIMSFNYAPRGWAMCNGQLLPINQNQPLFSLLGTTFGGNGQTNFALPDLRGRVPVHVGGGNDLGTSGGEQTHTLSQSEMPMHTHVASGSNSEATASIPSNTVLLAQGKFECFRPPSSLGTMQPPTIANTGGSQAHENMQPYLALSFCIALQGIFPSRN